MMFMGNRAGMFLSFSLLLAILYYIKSYNISSVSLEISEGNTREKLKEMGISKLLENYTVSNKKKKYYEVVSSRGNGAGFILNYNRPDQRLTICLDPGSGWSNQFVDITEKDLEEFVSKKFTIDDFSLYEPLSPTGMVI